MAANQTDLACPARRNSVPRDLAHDGMIRFAIEVAERGDVGVCLGLVVSALPELGSADVWIQDLTARCARP